MPQSLLEQIAAATAGEYDIVGALGGTARGSAFLARDVASGYLVVLFVPADAEELAVLAALNDEVPANAGRCTACGHAPAVWAAECPDCHRAFVLAAVDAHRFSVDEVHAATAHAYDVEGEVAHQAGGSLFFVRDRADGRLVALAAQVDTSGEQVLEAVWDAAAHRPPAGATAGVATGGVSATAAFGDPGGGYVPADGGGPGLAGVYQSPDASAPDFAPFGEDSAAPPVARRRRWVPLAVAGALLLAGGATWALIHRAEPAVVEQASVPADTARSVAVAPTPPAAPTETARDTGEGIDATSARRAPSARDSARAADSARVAAARRSPAYVQIDGVLPDGWTLRVNDRAGPSAPTVKLRLNRPTFLQVEAPGYCPDTLHLAPPAPGSVQHWTPRLRGKPMVGEC